MTTYYVDSAGNDANAGTSAGSGNSWLTFQKAADTAVAGDTVYLKSDKTYAELVDFDTNAGTVANRIRFIGYDSTTTDGGKITVSGSGSRASCLSFNGTADYVSLHNMILTDATTQCILGSTNNTVGLNLINVRLLKGSGSPTRGFYAGGYNRWDDLLFYGGEVSGFSTVGIIGLASQGPAIIGVKIVDNGIGISVPNYSSCSLVARCVIAGNGTYGIDVGGNGANTINILSNTFEGNGTAGVNIATTSARKAMVVNNIFANHSGAGDYGLQVGTISSSGIVRTAQNYYYNNTNDATTGYTSPLDVSVGADPFTSVAGDNWTLNNNNPGGGQVRLAAFPGNMDGTNIGYLDGGALQHQDSGGGGGSTTFFIPVE